MVLNILLWALFGLIAGVVAKFIGGQRERTDPAGVILTIVLGIAGALVGGFLSSQLFGWDINSFSVAGFAIALLLWWFLGPNAVTSTVPKVGNISNLSVPDVTRLSTDLTGTFKSLTETLTGIKGAASAEAALPTLKELNGKLESAKAVMDRLPEAGKSTISSLARSALDKLRGLADKVLAMAGVGDKIKPVVDAIMNNLTALAG